MDYEQSEVQTRATPLWQNAIDSHLVQRLMSREPGVGLIRTSFATARLQRQIASRAWLADRIINRWQVGSEYDADNTDSNFVWRQNASRDGDTQPTHRPIVQAQRIQRAANFTDRPSISSYSSSISNADGSINSAISAPPLSQLTRSFRADRSEAHSAREVSGISTSSAGIDLPFIQRQYDIQGQNNPSRPHDQSLRDLSSDSHSPSQPTSSQSEATSSTHALLTQDSTIQRSPSEITLTPSPHVATGNSQSSAQQVTLSQADSTNRIQRTAVSIPTTGPEQSQIIETKSGQSQSPDNASKGSSQNYSQSTSDSALPVSATWLLRKLNPLAMTLNTQQFVQRVSAPQIGVTSQIPFTRIQQAVDHSLTNTHKTSDQGGTTQVFIQRQSGLDISALPKVRPAQILPAAKSVQRRSASAQFNRNLSSNADSIASSRFTQSPFTESAAANSPFIQGPSSQATIDSYAASVNNSIDNTLKATNTGLPIQRDIVRISRMPKNWLQRKLNPLAMTLNTRHYAQSATDSVPVSVEPVSIESSAVDSSSYIQQNSDSAFAQFSTAKPHFVDSTGSFIQRQVVYPTETSYSAPVQIFRNATISSDAPDRPIGSLDSSSSQAQNPNPSRLSHTPIVQRRSSIHQTNNSSHASGSLPVVQMGQLTQTWLQRKLVPLTIQPAQTPVNIVQRISLTSEPATIIGDGNESTAPRLIATGFPTNNHFVQRSEQNFSEQNNSEPNASNRQGSMSDHDISAMNIGSNVHIVQPDSSPLSLPIVTPMRIRPTIGQVASNTTIHRTATVNANGAPTHTTDTSLERGLSLQNQTIQRSSDFLSEPTQSSSNPSTVIQRVNEASDENSGVGINEDELTRKIYRKLMRQLNIEQERRGGKR